MLNVAVVSVVTPLLGAFACVVSHWLTGRSREHWIAMTALSISAVTSLYMLIAVLTHGAQTYLIGDWSPPWGIVYVTDPFNAALICLLAWGSLLNLMGVRREITERFPDKTQAFYALYLLCTAGHLGIVSTGDAFNLYVLVEISALSGYALLSMGTGRSQLTSLNYLLMGSVGASFYLLGIGFLYMKTGTLNMADMHHLLEPLVHTPVVLAALAIIIVGLAVKMALFPFHSWLPGAYGEATPVAASLIAPMTTKVMAYALIRITLAVLPPSLMASVPAFSEIMVWTATAAIVVGGVMALAQRELRRMLCFILVAEVGYMAGGIFIGNHTALTGAVLHVFADAAMTLCVFMAMANISRRRGTLRFENLRGLFGAMPWTMTAFTAGALSMIGVPPFCGFFSKWYLVKGAMEAGQWPFVVALILSSLVNALLFFRVFELAFFERGCEECSDVRWTRLAPLAVVAAALPLIGLATGPIVQRVITPLFTLAS
ncbi:NADH/Ubiquinone/plastoquinone (complex I) [Desulfovibrio sp. X2]|uniref:complex I subunit 5 family protein n=1 Tax=Desulfovibrio sp. X2 TaxID=941449 RepID=UPI000358C27E|nr:proton-conducting transporter membrane subunit [Desulfovibrio sp. X2]EPR36328.1 NADH/Ubiquinone/plastoquinone (complex I) [Desulfovibrio sp. X2]